MILLDATALVGFFREEPAAEEVARLLDESECSISVVNLAEVHDRLLRRFGAEPDDLAEAFADLTLAGLEVAPLYEEVAITAGELRAEHYDGRTRPLSLADCVLLATAMAHGLTIASSDAPVVGVARAVGLDVHPLPNSTGVVPG